MTTGKYSIIVSLLLLLSININAASFRYLNIENGLSSRKVLQITNDAAGYLWLITQRGIDRFDGTEIRHYTLDDSISPKDYLSASPIMANDREGNLTIALPSGKIYTFNPLKDRFNLLMDLSQMTESGATTDGLPLNNIYYDKENRLWLCTPSGLYTPDHTRKELIPIATFDGEAIRIIRQYNENIYYIGTNHNLYRLEITASEETIHASGKTLIPLNANIESLCLYGDDLFAGTSVGSIFRIDTETEEVFPLSLPIPSVPIRSMIEAPDSGLLVGTHGAGLYHIDTHTYKIINHYTHNVDDPRSISSNHITNLFVDDRNCIWIATSTNGISLIDPSYPRVDWTRHEYKNSNSLLSNQVNTILEDSDGDLWFGTNSGLSLYQTSSGKWSHFLEEGKTGYAHIVLSLSEDQNRSIWVGGNGFGAYKIHKPTLAIKQLPIPKEDAKAGISTGEINSIYADKDYIWIGEFNKKLTSYSIKENTCQSYPIDCISDISEGDLKTLLLALCDGLAILDRSNGEITTYKEFGGKPIRHPVLSLLQSSNNDIWIATEGDGLIRFNPASDESEWFTTENGIESNTIYNIQEDHAARLWFTTINSIYCLDPNTRDIRNMDHLTGSRQCFYTANASLRKRNGNLAFATTKGVFEFSPDSALIQHEGTIDIILTDVSIFNRTVSVDEDVYPSRNALNYSNRAFFKYENNTFAFSFSALNFTFPDQIEYQYMLDGYDKDWRTVHSLRTAEYINVPSGRYDFKVKAIHQSTGKEVGYKEIHVWVGRSFWFSFWAMVFYMLLGIGIISLITYPICKQIQEQNEREQFDFSVQKARIHDILQDKEQSKSILNPGESISEQIKDSLPQDKEFHSNAIRIIEEHLSNPEFSVNEFCQQMGMSRTSVYTRLKGITDQAPQDFIRTIRLNKAKELLKSKKYTIAEVALMVGFSDPKYFSTSFKKQFGKSPSKVE